MVRLSVSVMAHPVRRPLVEELLGQLGDVPVSWDKHAEPSPDPERRWATGRAAWEMHDPSADWHLVIQDDALVSDNFREGLSAALDHVPFGVVVSAYLGTKRPQQQAVQNAIGQARKSGAAWAVMRSLNWGPAIVVPTQAIRPMLDWSDRKTGLAYDKRIGVFFRDELGWGCWYTWPSLVDHRQGPSISGHGNIGRFAHEFAADALQVDWSRVPDDDGARERAFRHRNTRRLVFVRDDEKAAQLARARMWTEVDVGTLRGSLAPLR